jgi:hypothetical protein
MSRRDTRGSTQRHLPARRTRARHPFAPPSDEGITVNTSLTATGSTSRQAAAVRAEAGRLRERLARRAGLALVAWSRAAEARRNRDDLARRAELRRDADRLRDENISTLALLARTL